MRYSLDVTKPVAAVAKKPFDFAAAAEALSENLEHTQETYREYAAAESRVLEIERVLEDLHTAVGSISKYGITVQNMALLNSDNCLDRALGMENLAVESLVSLSAETLTSLKSQYVAGLENKASEMFKKAVEIVKNFFTKLVQWLKDIFSGNAKIVKMVEEAKFEGVDTEKKVSVISFEDAKKAVETMQTALDEATSLAKPASQTIAEAKSAQLPTFEKKADTLKNLGWDAGSAKAIKDLFIKAAQPRIMDTAWKAIQMQYKSIAAQNGEDPTMKDKLMSSYKNWRIAAKVTGNYSKLLRQVGFALLAVSRASKGAPSPTPAPAPAK